MIARRLVRSFLVLIALLVTAGSVVNVFLDNAEVRAEAEKIGCGERPLTCAVTRMERTPVHQSFELTTKASTVNVVCTRSAILFGSYHCAKE